MRILVGIFVVGVDFVDGALEGFWARFLVGFEAFGGDCVVDAYLLPRLTELGSGVDIDLLVEVCHVVSTGCMMMD